MATRGTTKGTAPKKGAKKHKGGGDGLFVRLGALVALAAAAGGALSTQKRLQAADPSTGTGERERSGPERTSPPATGIKGKLHDLGNRFKPLGVVLDVQQRFSELHGNNLASAVTLQIFVALFPLLLVLISIIGFFSANSGRDVAADLISALGLTDPSSQELFTDAIANAEESRRATSVVGLVGLAWSALGIVSALQYGYDQVWQVEARGVKDKLVGLLWFLGFAVVAIASGVLTAILRFLPDALAPVGLLVAVGVNFVLFLWTSKILPNRDVGWRPLVPGALAAAIGFEVLKVLASYVVPRQVASASELYGPIGVVFAVIAFLLLLGRLVIYSACLNVVLYERKRGTREVVIEVPNTPDITDNEANRSGQADPEDGSQAERAAA